MIDAKHPSEDYVHAMRYLVESLTYVNQELMGIIEGRKETLPTITAEDEEEVLADCFDDGEDY